MVMLSSHRSSDVSPALRMPRNTTKSLRFPASSQFTCSCRRQQSHSPHPQNPNPHGAIQPTQSEGLKRDITSCWEHLEARTPSARVAEPRGKKCETSLCDAGVVCSGGKSIFKQWKIQITNRNEAERPLASSDTPAYKPEVARRCHHLAFEASCSPDSITQQAQQHPWGR